MNTTAMKKIADGHYLLGQFSIRRNDERKGRHGHWRAYDTQGIGQCNYLTARTLNELLRDIELRLQAA